ncbi:Cys-tRNA(Pro) deacylase [Olsenella sp. An290]|uniref:Cys-tRNA(Pro) deacylase n=1 Tax=Olsenella sp. An290 TaxID=1965625 RepID=UPI000B375D0C|nr:Cys-tRNA(Pro) deacylase [Olsenella sp. An290]OUO35596.1 aminoacyl-tRNA deacylase [Olsenella sp. An290]
MARREKLQKTNAMRELEAAGVPFSYVTYEVDETDTSSELGLHIAERLGEDPAASLKTLVCVTPSGGHVVCCIPVADELDLKKAAAAAGEKSLALMHVRDLEPVTGYVRGGCSPVGMKKRFPTLIDETAQLFDEVHVSGGRRGLSLALAPDDLAGFCGAAYADLVRG